MHKYFLRKIFPEELQLAIPAVGVGEAVSASLQPGFTVLGGGGRGSVPSWKWKTQGAGGEVEVLCQQVTVSKGSEGHD